MTPRRNRRNGSHPATPARKRHGGLSPSRRRARRQKRTERRLKNALAALRQIADSPNAKTLDLCRMADATLDRDERTAAADPAEEDA